MPIKREELITKIAPGMRVQCETNMFHAADEGPLTIVKIENFCITYRKENGAEFYDPLTPNYDYEITEEFISKYAHDRSGEYILVERKRILH